MNLSKIKINGKDHILVNRIDWKLALLFLVVIWAVAIISKCILVAAGWTLIIVAYDIIALLLNKIVLAKVKD